MNFDTVLYNIELLRGGVLIADANLNIISKNAFARMGNLKTRLGASLNHYFSKPDLTKLIILENRDYVIVDYIKGNITSFVAVRYDIDGKTYYFMYEAHIPCFIEKRISLHNFLTNSKCAEHYVKITEEICKGYVHAPKPTDRQIAKYLKIYNFIRHLITISFAPDHSSYRKITDIIYEINGVTKIFDVLTKSIGMNVVYKPGVRKEVVGKYNRGDVFLTAMIMLYFALLSSNDRNITCRVMNYESAHYFSVDFATSLKENIVHTLITDPKSLSRLAETGEYDYFYMLTLIQKLMNCYNGEISLLLPGNSLSNMRILAKFVEHSGYANIYHESSWLEEQSYNILEYISEDSKNNSEGSGSSKSTYQKIYDVVKRIPKGKVANYGLVAMLAGNSRWSRVVGYALHVNPDPKTIPCHRVVNKRGELSSSFAFGGKNRQRQLLEEEGITFLPDGKVNLEKHFWDINEALKSKINFK